MRTLVLIFTFVFAVTLLFSSYYLFPGFSSLVDKYVPWFGGGSGTERRFGSLIGIGEEVELAGEPTGPEVTPAVGVFYKFLQDSEAYAQDNVNVAYWQNWNWQTHFFWADVLYDDEAARVVDLKFGSPQTLGQRNGVSLLCEPQNNVSFYHENLTLRKTNFDVFEDIEAGDVLYSQCLNEACTSAGNYCFLIKKASPQ